MKNRINSLIFISTIVLMAVSCTKEDIFDSGDNNIRVVVSASTEQTKSAVSGQDGRFIGSYTLDSFGVDSLCIAVYEFDNSDFPQGLSHDTDLQTKGVVITNDLINQNGQQFRMDAWLESLNRVTGDASDYHFMKEATATRGGTGWTLSCASTSAGSWNTWRNKVPTNFWAMYPASLGSGHGSISLSLPADDASDEGQKALSFNYTLQDHSTDDTDAENQPDLCFAYSHKTWDKDVAGNDNTVNIRFYHVLSAVYFNISGVSSSDPGTSITVKKIGFKNVPSSAHCEMTGTLGASEGNPGVPAMTWSGQESASLKDYKQTYQSSDFDESSQDLKLEGNGKVFMMIPGTLNADTELWAEFEVNGSTVEKSVNISKYSNGTSAEWMPGKKYLYKLVYNGSGDLGLTGGLGPYLPDWWE